MSPPITTAAGFSRLIATASTSPSCASAVAEQPAGERVALERQRHQVAHVVDGLAGLGEPGDQ